MQNTTIFEPVILTGKYTSPLTVIRQYNLRQGIGGLGGGWVHNILVAVGTPWGSRAVGPQRRSGGGGRLK